MRLSCFLIGIFSATSAFASGGQIGNGGDAVVCYEGEGLKQVSSVELFDHWEMKQTSPTGTDLSLGNAEAGVEEKIRIAAARVRVFDPGTAQRIEEVALSIARNIGDYLVPKSELPEIEDESPRTTPRAPCRIEQLAVQWKSMEGRPRRFAIAKEWYEHARATNDLRAGILLHEAIYRHAIQAGAQDSRGVRYFNFAISSAMLERSALSDYFEILRESKWLDPTCVTKEFLIPTRNRRLEVLARPVSADEWRLCVSTAYEMEKLKFVWPENTNLRLGERSLYVGFVTGTQLELLSNGQWTRYEVTGGFIPLNTEGSRGMYVISPTSIPFTLEVNGESAPCAHFAYDWAIRLGSRGQVIGCWTTRDMAVRVRGESGRITAGYPLFDDQGRLREGNLRDPLPVVIAGADRPAIAAGMSSDVGYRVEFNEEEKLIRGTITKGIPVEILGKTEFVTDINYPDANGMMNVTIDRVFEARVNGLRILASRWEDMHPVCVLRGFKYNHVEEVQEIYVAGQEKFHDARTGLGVAKTDERVKIMAGTHTCSARFAVSIR